MSEKRKSGDSSSNSKKRHTITLETKVNIIKRHDSGEKVVDIARSYLMNESTIRTIIRDKERIKGHVRSAPQMQTTIITKKRGTVMEEMERLLCFWIEDQYQRRMPLSLRLIKEKALSLFKALQDKHGDNDDTFNASSGWFNRFKSRAKLHNIKVTGEAASADSIAATEFPKLLTEVIENENYRPQQVFNMDETGLYWKKMPDRSYIAKEEKTMPGYKASKDRLTLLLGGNVSGDYKIKPLLVYHSENPRALKNIAKESLPVIWKSNAKAWVTQSIFQDWFSHSFVPEVKNYCEKNNIPFRILLLLDNAPGHPATLCDDHENIKLMYLPPNTTSLIQPLDQGVIATFKKYYLRKTFRQAVKATEGENGITLKQFWKEYNIFKAVENIDAAWREVAVSTMNAGWRKLVPQFIHKFRGFEEEHVVDELVEMATALELDVDGNDFRELIECDTKELTNEDIMELVHHREKIEISEQEKDDKPPKRFESKRMAECFHLIEEALAGFEEQDPNTERFTSVSKSVHDALACYKMIYEEKKKAVLQTSMDKYIRKTAN